MNKPIKFTGGQSSGLDELAGGVPPQINVFTDAAGSAWMRPGIVAWEGFPDDVAEQTAGEVFPAGSGVVTGIAVRNGYVVWTEKFTTPATAVFAPNIVITLFNTLDISGGVREVGAASDARIAGLNLFGSRRPVFSASREALWIAGGGDLLAWEGPGNFLTAVSPDLDDVAVSHVAAVNQRIVANDAGVSGLIYWSNVGDANHFNWETGAEFREAETEPDAANGMYKSAGELVVIGPRTIQMFSPDPSVTFSPSRTIPFGSNAPYSFVGIDEQFFLLDTKSRIMLSNGRSYQSVSTPAIGRDIERMAMTDDCWGFRFNCEGHDIAVFNFPTAGRTFAYDLPAQQWNEWRSWRNGAWAPLAITAHCYDEDRKIHLVGLANGKIAKLSMDAHDELGEPLIAELTSTFVDHGTMAWKLSKVVRFRFRRGRAANSQACAVVSYRDDLGPFGEPFRLPLGDSSDVSPTVEIRSAGRYQQRQWRVQVDSNEFVFAGAEEDFDVLQG